MRIHKVPVLKKGKGLCKGGKSQRAQTVSESFSGYPTKLQGHQNCEEHSNSSRANAQLGQEQKGFQESFCNYSVPTCCKNQFLHFWESIPGPSCWMTTYATGIHAAYFKIFLYILFHVFLLPI